MIVRRVRAGGARRPRSHRSSSPFLGPCATAGDDDNPAPLLRPQYFDVVAFEAVEADEARQGARRSAATAPLAVGAAASAFAARGAAARLCLGVVLDASPDSSLLTVAPLRKACDWAESGLWVEGTDDGQAAGGGGDANALAVPNARVVAIVGDALLSQRQDTEHNPHGEHAHDVWELPLPGVVWGERVGATEKEALAELLSWPSPG